MKHFHLLCIGAFIGFNLSVNASTSEPQDLERRLAHYKPDSYTAAIENLIATNPSYKPEKDWQQAVQALKNDKENLLAALKDGDEKAIKTAEKLLHTLDASLLNNPLVRDKQIVGVRRVLGNKARSAMGGGIGISPNNFSSNSSISKPKENWDNAFVAITPSKGKIKTEAIYQPPKGMIITDPEPHFDGERMMYASIGSHDRWHLFEWDAKTGEARQLTPDTYEDFDSYDGCYTPDGRYVFCSTGTFLGLPCTDGGGNMCGIFSYDPETGRTRQLTYDQDSNWGPAMMENGQVLYQRWEYADLPHSNSRIMFTMNPDGTEQRAYYGSNSYFPTSYFNARPIPGWPTAMIGTATGHHGNSRSGRLIIIDTKLGRKEADGVVCEIPYAGKKVEPLVRDRFADGVWPQFLQPWPLNENYYLVTMKADPTALWGIYLVDRFDNMTLVMEEEGTAWLEPVMLESQKTPAAIPDRVDLDSETATIYIQDIYAGGGLKDIPRGAAKKLRIGTYDFSPWGQGGLLGTIGMDGPWDIKLIIGEADIEEDGSVMVEVPANIPLFVQPLDAEGKALQVMRSWLTAMPGEVLSCIGCHEDRDMIAIPKVNQASKRAPQKMQEWNGERRGFSYRHEVQPVLDRYCIGCHSDEKKTDRPYLKGDKMIKDWSSQIGGRAWNGGGGEFSLSYANLHRYVRRPGIESDMDMLVPMDVHADQTELMQLIEKGHYNVKVDSVSLTKLSCWIDFNAPYHGRRKDISTFHRTDWSCKLRKIYLEMFGAPDYDMQWLPEIPTDIEYEHPEKLTLDKTKPVLEGWPYYDPTKTPYASWGATHNKQLALGVTQQRVELGNGIALDLVHIPAGEFVMGSDRQADEMPQNIVKVEKSYWIGRFEITNEQFRAFDPTHDSRDEHRHGYQFGREGYSMNHDDQPAVRLSWQQAMNYCEWLSEKTGMKFSLPTEAEWEWACRAGSSSAFWFGELGSDFSRYANLGDIRLKEFAACTSFKNYESARVIDNPSKYDDWIPRDTVYNDGGFISEPVGSYVRNPWDLFDMHGNVWEWTLSQYAPYPYNATDGRNDGASSKAKRVARGGSWYDRAFRSTSTFRLPYRDYQKVYNVGFRVVMHE